MDYVDDYFYASKIIKTLADRALVKLTNDRQAYKIANFRSYRPVDYHRCAEFAGILGNLKIYPGEKVLDIGSPQWFTMLLANNYPENNFIYINIMDEEVFPYQAIAQACDLKNVCYQVSDVRKLPFANNVFDKIISISALEHVYPEIGGDDQAIQEIHRVIKPSGICTITLPFKEKSGLVYAKGPVFERRSIGKNFFARLYDKDSFGKFIKRNNFSVMKVLYSCEKIGILSPDFYEWGPGKRIPLFGKIIQSRKYFEHILKISFEEMLAYRYLINSETPKSRLVNIIALLKPTIESTTKKTDPF